MRLALASLASLALSLCSCGVFPVTIKVDPTCPPEMRGGVERAAWRWSAFADTSVRVDDDGDWLVLPVDVPGGWNGHVDHERQIIRISPRSSEPFSVVALHELGHVLGLKDLAPGLDGVMDATRPTSEWSIHDRNECRARGPC